MRIGLRSVSGFRPRRSRLRPALLAALAVGAVSLALVPTAHAQQTHPVTHNLNECYFDGQPHTRNFGNTNYGTVFIISDELRHPPQGFGPRPRAVQGMIMPGITVGQRHGTPQPSSGLHTGGEPDVDPGHVMALHLGGPDNSFNIVPQWSHWQQLGAWRKMEQELDEKARKIADDSRPPGGGPPTRSILYTIDIDYRDSGNVTPTLTGWSFPKSFLVSACPVKLSARNRCDGPMIFHNKKFEGEPPH